MPIRPPDRLIARLLVAGVLLGSLASCARRGARTGDYCGTVVIAAAGEPDILLPPVTELSTSRDVYDQLFLKLADLGMSGNTIGDEDFQPQLAERWEWNGPVTLVFHLDPRARWQDGRVVTAGDVVFTYDAYTDSLVNSPFRSSLRLISAVTARDSLTAVFRFRQRYPEMFYDAVYQMRVLPARVLSLQGGRVRLSRLQPRNARRLDQAPSPVRRPRAAPRARHGRGPHAPAAQRVRRFRQGPARPDLAARLDLGPRDTRAAARQRAGGAGAVQPRALREPRVRPLGGPRRGGDEPRRGTASLADRNRGPEPGRPGDLPVRARCRGGGAPPDHGRHDPPGLVARAAPHLAHSRRPADRSRPRGALGVGVDRAASRRRDRHRPRGRHPHLLPPPPRWRLAVRAARRPIGGARGVRAPARPVRARPAHLGAVRQISLGRAARRPGPVVLATPSGDRRAGGRDAEHAGARGHGAAHRLHAGARPGGLPGRAGAPLRRYRARERRAVRQFDADVLAGARPAARVRPMAPPGPRGRDA